MTRQPMTPLISDSAKAQELADWQAQFDPIVTGAWSPVWISDGRRREDVVYDKPQTWWHCPACGDLVTSAYMLLQNHGWDPERPGRAYVWGDCIKMELQKAHAAYDKKRAMIRHLVAQGLTDEQIAKRMNWWPAEVIAGYRKDDAAAARLAARAAKGERVTVGHGDQCPCAFCGGACTCMSCLSFRGGGPSKPVAKQEPALLTLF